MGVKPRSCRTLSPTDAAYLAGLLDGEGTIGLTTKGDQYRGYLSITSTNAPVIEWVQQITGLGSVANRGPGALGRKTRYGWMVFGSSVVTVLTQVLPYLRIKQTNAEHLLKFYEARGTSQWVDENWLQEMKIESHRLNGRAA